MELPKPKHKRLTTFPSSVLIQKGAAHGTSKFLKHDCQQCVVLCFEVVFYIRGRLMEPPKSLWTQRTPTTFSTSALLCKRAAHGAANLTYGSCSLRILVFPFVLVVFSLNGSGSCWTWLPKAFLELEMKKISEQSFVKMFNLAKI